jgi:hypothetical protein
MQKPALESILNDITVIRTTIEAFDQIPPADPVRVEMLGTVADARGSLIARLQEFARFTPSNYRMSACAFKDAAINLMLIGYSRKSLGPMRNSDLFHEIAETKERYVYEFLEPVDIISAQSLSADLLYVLFAADILQSAENEANYDSKQQFDHNIVRKLVAFLSAVDAGGGGFDTDSNSGHEDTSPVPRTPFPPQFTGSAAEAVPEPIAPETVLESASIA